MLLLGKMDLILSQRYCIVKLDVPKPITYDISTVI